MDTHSFLSREAEAYADLFDGGFVIRSFVRSVIEGYDGRTDWRDFSPEERTEILLNCHRMIELLRQAEAH